MLRRKTPWLAAAFVAGVFLVGLPHWAAPADRGGLDPQMIAGLAGIAALAMMLVVGQVASAPRAWVVMASCLPAAVLIRMLGEPVSHTLWPLDLALAFAVAVAAVLPGAVAGAIAHRLQSRGRG